MVNNEIENTVDKQNRNKHVHDISSHDKTSSDNKCIVIFRSSLVQECASGNLRLPTNYVGVRQVRPSNISSSGGGGGSTTTIQNETIELYKLRNSNFKFSVIDEDGNERRMTRAEKKARKLQMAQERKDLKKRKADEMLNPSCSDKVKNTSTGNENVSQNKNESLANDITNDSSSSTRTASASSTYHHLPLDANVMEEELVESRNERSSLPPAILSPPMAMQYTIQKETDLFKRSKSAVLIYNHGLSQEWANRLKQECILPAEEIRQLEDLRPLAYKVNPEPWQRMRPSLEETALSTIERNVSIDDVHKSKNDLTTYSIQIPKPSDWAFMTCRPSIPARKDFVESSSTRTLDHDSVISIVFEYIYKETPYHISCGAKFGSDFLIYDGPREERHAFGGLRVLSSTTTPNFTHGTSTSSKSLSLPLPTAYSLTSFVRCLNTAGKLALLATVVPMYDESSPSKRDNGELHSAEATKYRVLFVDVALEKVLDAPTHQRRLRTSKGQQEKRKDVTKNLAKK